MFDLLFPCHYIKLYQFTCISPSFQTGSAWKTSSDTSALRSASVTLWYKIKARSSPSIHQIQNPLSYPETLIPYRKETLIVFISEQINFLISNIAYQKTTSPNSFTRPTIACSNDLHSTISKNEKVKKIIGSNLPFFSQPLL